MTQRSYSYRLARDLQRLHALGSIGEQPLIVALAIAETLLDQERDEIALLILDQPPKATKIEKAQTTARERALLATIYAAAHRLKAEIDQQAEIDRRQAAKAAQAAQQATEPAAALSAAA
jgi:thioesterase domain-containing protein